MKSVILTASLVSVLTLSGCVSNEQMERNKERDAQRAQSESFDLAGCYSAPQSEMDMIKSLAASSPSVKKNVFWFAQGDGQVLMSRKAPKIPMSPNCLSQAQKQCKALGQMYGDSSTMIATVGRALEQPGAVRVTCTKV